MKKRFEFLIENASRNWRRKWILMILFGCRYIFFLYLRFSPVFLLLRPFFFCLFFSMSYQLFIHFQKIFFRVNFLLTYLLFQRMKASNGCVWCFGTQTYCIIFSWVVQFLLERERERERVRSMISWMFFLRAKKKPPTI